MSEPTSSRRFGQAIRLRKDCVDQYKACHAKAWPEVLKQIKDSKIEDCKFRKEAQNMASTLSAPPLLGQRQFTDVALDVDGA